jgi:hypothetical protein
MDNSQTFTILFGLGMLGLVIGVFIIYPPNFGLEPEVEDPYVKSDWDVSMRTSNPMPSDFRISLFVDWNNSTEKFGHPVFIGDDSYNGYVYSYGYDILHTVYVSMRQDNPQSKYLVKDFQVDGFSNSNSNKTIVNFDIDGDKKIDEVHKMIPKNKFGDFDLYAKLILELNPKYMEVNWILKNDFNCKPLITYYDGIQTLADAIPDLGEGQITVINNQKFYDEVCLSPVVMKQ